MYDTLVNRICDLADSQPDQPAVAYKKESISYLELKNKMVMVGSRLVELGIKRGDRVLFSAVSKPEMVVIYLGIQYIGAVAVFVDKNVTVDNALFMYKDTKASIFITDKFLNKDIETCNLYSLRGLYNENVECETEYVVPNENDLAEMIYTSGTTGVPKGVMLTYKSVYQIWTNTIEGVGLRADERILLPLPLNHSFALRVLRAALYQGALIVLQNGFTFAKEIENNQNNYGCTAIAIVPASVETITKQMQDKFAEIMGRFRYIEVSAGSLSLEQRRRLIRQLPNTIIFNTWGSSESGGALFLNVSEVAGDEQKITALGKPLPSVEIKTLDEQGREFISDSEHPGRMALKGDMQMTGYWNRSELTRETLKDGWLLTSDIIYLDAEGYVYMLGRADDIINVGGEKVSPVEVENIAGEYEDIAECACIGVPDPDEVLGSIPILFIVSKSGRFNQDSLVHFLAQKMEKYKMPVKYIQLVELPRNKMQKVDRKALRETWNKRGDTNLVNQTVQNLLTRRSIRKFNDRPISREIMEMIVTTGYYAPTGHNMQTWKFTVILNRNQIQKLKETVVLTAQENNVYCYGFENPVAVILVSNDERNPYSCQNASCASENIMISAWSYGIGSVWLNPLMTLRKKEPMKSLLDSYGIPENHIVWSMIALGYPVSEGTLLKKKTDVIRWIE